MNKLQLDSKARAATLPCPLAAAPCEVPAAAPADCDTVQLTVASRGRATRTPASSKMMCTLGASGSRSKAMAALCARVSAAVSVWNGSPRDDFKAPPVRFRSRRCCRVLKAVAESLALHCSPERISCRCLVKSCTCVAMACDARGGACGPSAQLYPGPRALSASRPLYPVLGRALTLSAAAFRVSLRLSFERE